MRGFSSFAPHLGAALGAGLMLAAALAFNAGAGGGLPARSDLSATSVDPSSGQPPAMSSPASPPGLTQDEARRRASAETRARPAPSEPSGAAISRPVLARLAVILDDVADLDAARRALALEAPVTVSVLPYAESAPVIAALVRESGRELFVHLPMEPVGLDDPGPYALTKELDRPAIEARLAFAFSRAPGAVGFNNHMGSRMTADPAAMAAVFAALDRDRAPGLFVDSLTHPRSQAAVAAAQAGLTALRRDVFLDHDRDPALINARIDEALALAKARGAAIAIAHPRPETFEALETLAARADAAGVEIVTVTEIAGP